MSNFQWVLSKLHPFYSLQYYDFPPERIFEKIIDLVHYYLWKYTKKGSESRSTNTFNRSATDGAPLEYNKAYDFK